MCAYKCINKCYVNYSPRQPQKLVLYSLTLQIQTSCLLIVILDKQVLPPYLASTAHILSVMKNKNY